MGKQYLDQHLVLMGIDLLPTFYFDYHTPCLLPIFTVKCFLSPSSIIIRLSIPYYFFNLPQYFVR